LICAAQLLESPLRSLCRVQRALSLLCAGAPGCASAALEALGALARAPEDAPGFAEQSGALFASALASLRRGDVADAKPRLSRALKCAHGELGNHELVAQVLNALGALVEHAGDPGQARDMLMSAFTLSKSAADVHAQAGALRVLARVHTATGAAKEAADMARYAAKKKGALAALCGEARSAAAGAAGAAGA
jgi:tetratricopeptide (TPR) repeat protein